MSIEHSVWSPLNNPEPITKQVWPDNIRPKVSIICTTYNHEKYIGECIEGFLMQETTFPVEIVVHDDASTDRTSSIIKQYYDLHPKIIRPIFNEQNQYSLGKKPSLLAFSHTNGDYIATCEGDDYWTLSSKLERQINIFEENPDCILCGGRVYVIRDGDQFPYRIEPSLEPDKLTNSGPMEMLKGEFNMRTLSRVAKRSVWEQYAQKVKDSSAAYDWLFTLYCISESKMAPNAFCCLNEVVGTYREHSGSVWYGADEEVKRQLNFSIMLFAIKEFNFLQGQGIIEKGFIYAANSIKLTEDMDADAHRLYKHLMEKHQPSTIIGRFRRLLIKLRSQNSPLNNSDDKIN